MLDKKLQLKHGKIIVIGNPGHLDLTTPQTKDSSKADALLIFIPNQAHLLKQLGTLKSFAASGKITWLAYPKAKQLNTDLNRDLIRDFANANGLDPVRQVALDEVWSALRLKS